VTLLALDTSTSEASIALTRDGMMLAELNWHVGQRHDSELLPRVSWLLDACGVAPADLTCVAVALGPGSFNGIRIAVAAAKALAFGLRTPLIGIPTLDCIAWGGAFSGQEIWAVLEAGRGQLYAARYAGPALSPSAWAAATGYLLVTPADMASRIQGTALICGEWRAETRRALEAALGARVYFAASLGGRRAIWLAELAMARAAIRQYDDATRIEPMYVRRPAITNSARMQTVHLARREGELPGGEEGERALYR
jgi:tRNA threonylcarbamoyladenosine biosynthesis protein TsaB